MSRGACAAIGLGLVLAVGCPGVAFAGSVLVNSQRLDYTIINGVGCGAAASVSIPLPATALDVRVREPLVGATTSDTRLVEAAVVGASVRLTAIGEGAVICDPAEDPDVPPAERRWSGGYDYDIAFRQRTSVRYWAGADSRRSRPRTRPRKVTMPLVAHVLKIRWRSFGGRKAVGYGRARSLAPPGIRCDAQTCPGNGGRVKVVLTRLRRCGDIKHAAYYSRIKFYPHRGRVLSPGEAVNPDFDPTCVSGARPI
jgi:hypothetical protein